MYLSQVFHDSPFPSNILLNHLNNNILLFILDPRQNLNNPLPINPQQDRLLLRDHGEPTASPSPKSLPAIAPALPNNQPGPAPSGCQSPHQYPEEAGQGLILF
jgi:hypothetical protein